MKKRIDANDDCLHTMSSDINKCFDTEFNDMKQKKVMLEDNINMHLDAIDKHLDSCLSVWEKQIQDNVNNIRKRKEERKRDTGKCNENTNNQVIDDKVSDGDNTSDNYNGEMMTNNNNDDVIENGVSESDTLNNNSDEESLMGVEVRDEVLVADEIERVCKESLSEYGGETANFPSGVSGVKTPQALCCWRTKVPLEVMWETCGLQMVP